MRGKMLFAQSFEFLSILPWIVVAVAVGVLAFIVIKCISMYRNLKRNKTEAKTVDETAPLIAIRGEYFVLKSGVEYLVGSDGQLMAGKYLLRGDGYDKFKVAVNGEERELNGDETLELNDGDRLSAVTCDTLIKPYTD